MDPLVITSLPILGGLVTGIATWSFNKVRKAVVVVDANAKLMRTVAAQALCIEALEARVKALVGQVEDYETRVIRLERILADSLEAKALRAKTARALRTEATT